MKRNPVSAVLGLFLAVALAAPASAEMYVEGYLGGTAAANVGQSLTVQDTLIPRNAEDSHMRFSGTPEAAVLGGVKLGTWFVKEGFAGYGGYPDWMKYFGFYTDFSYQRFELRGPTSGTSVDTFGLTGAALNAGEFTSQGSIATWAFMFAGRYGFYPDSEVPFGRLQPYVAVGPAVMFSSLSPKLNTQFVDGGPDLTVSGNSQASTNLALAVDAGIRIMALKNVSLDISFKYRYAQPSYTFNGIDFNLPATFKLNPVYQLFSGQVGVAYHF